MRTRKSLLNIISSLVNQIVSTACALIAPRLILQVYGSTYNGAVSSITQLLSMVSVLTLGVAGATRAALYRPLASGDTETVSKIVRTNKRYMRRVACVLVGYIGVLMLIYPYISHTELGNREIALLVLAVSLGTLAEYLFGSSNRALLSADQSGYVFYVIDIIAKIVRTVLLVLIVRSGASALMAYFGSSLVLFVSPLVMNIWVTRKYRLDTACRPDSSLIPQKSAAAFHSIANIIHGNTDVVVLTLFTDAKIISVYAVYHLVVSKIKSILQIMTEGMEGAFGNIWAKKERETFESVFSAYESALFSFACIAFSCVAVLLLPFIELYTSGVHDTNYIIPALAALITVTETVFCIREPYRTVVQATGNYEATKKSALAEAIVNLTVSLVLVQFIGILGVIVGTLLANLIRTTQFAIFTYRKILGISLRRLLAKIAWLAAEMGLIILTAWLLIGLLPPTPGWLGWVIKAAVAVAVSGTVTMAGLRVFYRDDFRRLWKTLRTMLHMRRKNG